MKNSASWPVDMTSVIKTFQTLFHNIHDSLTPNQQQSAAEVMRRLRQVEYALAQVARLLNEASRNEATAPFETNLITRMCFYSESFYLFAFRIREAIRQIPGFKNFECIGVRDVRNWLICHPEASNARDIIFAYSSTWPGPLVRGYQSYRDNPEPISLGLFPDAAEFLEKLEEIVARNLKMDHAQP